MGQSWPLRAAGLVVLAVACLVSGAAGGDGDSAGRDSYPATGLTLLADSADRGHAEVRFLEARISEDTARYAATLEPCRREQYNQRVQADWPARWYRIDEHPLLNELLPGAVLYMGPGRIVDKFTDHWPPHEWLEGVGPDSQLYSVPDEFNCLAYDMGVRFAPREFERWGKMAVLLWCAEHRRALAIDAGIASRDAPGTWLQCYFPPVEFESMEGPDTLGSYDLYDVAVHIWGVRYELRLWATPRTIGDSLALTPWRVEGTGRFVRSIEFPSMIRLPRGARGELDEVKAKFALDPTLQTRDANRFPAAQALTEAGPGS